MRKKLQFLKFDLLLQRILGIIYLSTGLFGFIIPSLFIIALLSQLALGVWQVISAIINSIINYNKERITYLAVVLTYLLLTSITSFHLSKKDIDQSFGLIILGLVIIPLALAIWYYLLTVKNHKSLMQAPDQNIDSDHEMEEILDSGELSRRN